MDFLIEPFQTEFVRNGAIAAAAVGVLCGVVGCFVILRGLALMADSLAHGLLPGIAIAFLLTAGTAGEDPNQLALSVGALAAGLVTALLTSAIVRRSGFRDDTATAVVFVLMLALGVVIVSRVEGYAVDLNSFLFGDVLGVSAGEALTTVLLAALGVGAVLALYRPFLLVSFDRQRAAALGLPVDRVQLVLLALLSVAVVIGFRVVGSLLVLGLLIAPAATAALVTRRLPAMMAVSAALAAASAPVGLLLSWHLDIAAGAAIVLVAVSLFAVVVAVRPAAG